MRKGFVHLVVFVLFITVVVLFLFLAKISTVSVYSSPSTNEVAPSFQSKILEDTASYKLELLTDLPGDYRSPNINNDLVAFTGVSGSDKTRFTMYLVNLAVGESKVLPGYVDYSSHPIISGNKILWGALSKSSSNTSIIYVYDTTTNKTREIDIRNGDVDRNLSFDNNKIAYMKSDQNIKNQLGAPALNIYLYDLNTANERQISFSNIARFPKIYGNIIVWQDGRNIKVDRNDNGGWSIYMYNLQTNTETAITNPHDGASSPNSLNNYGAYNPQIWSDLITYLFVPNCPSPNQCTKLVSAIRLYNVKEKNTKTILDNWGGDDSAYLYASKILYYKYIGLYNKRLHFRMNLLDTLSNNNRLINPDISTIPNAQTLQFVTIPGLDYSSISGNRIVLSDNTSGEYKVYLYELKDANLTLTTPTPISTTSPKPNAEKPSIIPQPSTSLAPQPNSSNISLLDFIVSLFKGLFLK